MAYPKKSSCAYKLNAQNPDVAIYRCPSAWGVQLVRKLKPEGINIENQNQTLQTLGKPK